MIELINEVEQVISFAKKVLKNAIPGSLYVKRQGKIRYFKRERGQTVGQYLKKDDKQIKQLEEKAYYTELLKVAEQEAESLKKARKILDSMPDYKSVFLSIPLEKRHLISPYEFSPEETDDGIIRLFNKKPVKEDLKLITQNGEHVRSKSELIIADRLKTAGIAYYYEDPLILADEEKSKGALTPCLYWHPDFKVQNVRTGKQYYWEHFGMLDNPEYCNSCQSKLEVYAKYGFFPGENLIITSESSEHGLNLEYVDRLIERYLK